MEMIFFFFLFSYWNKIHFITELLKTFLAVIRIRMNYYTDPEILHTDQRKKPLNFFKNILNFSKQV